MSNNSRRLSGPNPQTFRVLADLGAVGAECLSRSNIFTLDTTQRDRLGGRLAHPVHAQVAIPFRVLHGLTDYLSHVRLTYKDEHGEKFVSSAIADRGEFWWNPKRPAESTLWESTLWESKIRLGEDFFNEVIRHPVPLDMNTLNALKRCALGLDLYLWLTYRTFALRAPQRITWRQIYRQFGVDPDKASNKFTVRSFREKALRELKKIKLAWPDLNYSTARGLLILHPSPPAIAPVAASPRLAQ